MNTVASIIWFIIILSIIVISHEGGHFLIARANGIRVNEFDVGMGPTVFSFTKGGTKFCLKALPFGGACIFDSVDLKDTIEGEEDKDPHAFKNAKVWARISTVFAGPFFNFILGMIFAIIIVAKCGSDLPVISRLSEGRPAVESGLSVGDTITKINKEKIHIWRDITIISYLNSGEPLEIEYEHEGKKYTTTLTPQYEEEENRYYIGIEGGKTYIECKGWNLIRYSFYELEFNFKNTLKALAHLIRGKLGVDALSGPVGLAEIVGDNYKEAKEYGVSSIVLTMMNIAMLLSVNLGVMNLLPIPALDGGRLVFLLVEAVRGKPIPAKYEGIVQLIGVILLFLLSIFVLFNDIIRLFH